MKTVVRLCFIMALVFPLPPAISQPRGGTYATREQILEGAKKEGKLFLHPALRPEYDKQTLPELLKAFGNKYPFVQPGWGVTKMGLRPNPKEAFNELKAGEAVVDVLGFSGSFPKDYPDSGVLKNYDLRVMARDGRIKIPLEMLDETGMIVWSSNNTVSSPTTRHW